jgi:hypothetical protein
MTMPIYQGLAAIRVRPNVEPDFLHSICNNKLNSYEGLQDTDQMKHVLKCDTCKTIIGEWSTEEEKRRELSEWIRQNTEV